MYDDLPQTSSLAFLADFSGVVHLSNNGVQAHRKWVSHHLESEHDHY